MVNDDLVSMIVPVYCMEPYLHRCVDSLTAQTHRNIEIILVDDGSTDLSGAICDEYAAADDRVRVVHQPNAGVSVARNVGIEAARGRWLAFVDPDDWVDAGLVSHLLGVARASDADLAVCGLFRTSNLDTSGALLAGSVRALSSTEALKLYTGPTTSWMTSPCGKLFRAELFEGVRFPPGRRYEDEFTTYRLVDAARRVAVSDAELYNYFIRPGSATHGEQDVAQLLDRVAALREQAGFFHARGLDDVSGNALKRAFLILRQLHPRIVASGDQASRRKLATDTKAVAADLRNSGQPRHVKALASFYSIWPQPVDAAVRSLQCVRGCLNQCRRDHQRKLPAGGAAEGTRPNKGGLVGSEPGEAATYGRGLEVIVVAYGSPEMLRRALEPVRELPITVVDNSSMPEIESLCDALGCRYIDPGFNGGFAAGVNVGLAHRQVPAGDVLLLNPDAVISEQSIRELQTALLPDDRLASVGPRQVDESGEPIRVTWPFPSPLGIWLDALALSQLRPASQYVSGAILLLRAEALEEVGEFDERFFLYAEEADWQYRASKRGWHNRVVDSVTAMHEGGGTSSNETKRLAHFHSSTERFMRKHYGAVGWQIARTGQVLGDLTRGLLRKGEARTRLWTRAALYLRGPMRFETVHHPRPVADA